MFEKVNPSHPDKVADRIAGAIVDVAYQEKKRPKIAVEVLVGHGHGLVILETDCVIEDKVIEAIVHRIAGPLEVKVVRVQQDPHLAQNQEDQIRCGDNGIFKGLPITAEEAKLAEIAKDIYQLVPHDGKYILDGDKLVICQSNIQSEELAKLYPKAQINPLGDWKGGLDVDSGATNRKLGSDMGEAVTGGGLHGKDLSKADVSINIYAHLLAQEKGHEVKISCAIGDELVDGRPYQEIVDIAADYIRVIGGFEKFAEWGLIKA